LLAEAPMPDPLPFDRVHEGAAPIDAFRADRVLEPVRRVLRFLSLVLLGVMILTPALQVLLREIFVAPFIGAEELSRFMLICVVMLALPYTISSGASIRMEELLRLFPKPLQKVAEIIVAGTGFLAFAFAAGSVMTATLRNLNNASPTLGIPYYIFFSAAFVGFLLAAVEFALQAYKALRNRPLYVTFDAEQPDEELTL
jgi:TRAP-type C4-dicarboxylate transport system permease small subunit